MSVTKKEVEELLGLEITDRQFAEALACAKRKQEYIYRREQRKAVMQRWYLAKLTEEYVRSLAFSEKTMGLCRMLRNMEKERPTKSQGAHEDNHIVANPAL